jgi:uncharacterized protein (TIGR03000 family)
MTKQIWKKLLFGTVVVATLLITVESANAGWGYYRAWSCGYASCCDPYYTSYYRLCSWPYGGCGSCSSCYSCSYPTYSCCGYTASSCCGATSTTAAPSSPMQPTPAKKPVTETPTLAPPVVPPEPGATTPSKPEIEPAPAIPPTTEPKTSSAPTPETSGVVTVWVPYDAKVTINGLATRSVGSRRQFVSFGLKPGFSYKFDIHAEVVRDGKLLEDNKTITLTAGATTAVAFGLNTTPAEAVAAN